MRSATKNHTGKDCAYLAWVHTQSCIIAGIGFPCSGPIEAHHAGEHGFSQRAPDRTAIPLCSNHHQYGRDAIHRLGKRFAEYHEIDLGEVIATLNQRYQQDRSAE